MRLNVIVVCLKVRVCPVYTVSLQVQYYTDDTSTHHKLWTFSFDQLLLPSTYYFLPLLRDHHKWALDFPFFEFLSILSTAMYNVFTFRAYFHKPVQNASVHLYIYIRVCNEYLLPYKYNKTKRIWKLTYLDHAYRFSQPLFQKMINQTITQSKKLQYATIRRGTSFVDLFLSTKTYLSVCSSIHLCMFQVPSFKRI